MREEEGVDECEWLYESVEGRGREKDGVTNKRERRKIGFTREIAGMKGRRERKSGGT